MSYKSTLLKDLEVGDLVEIESRSEGLFCEGNTCDKELAICSERYYGSLKSILKKQPRFKEIVGKIGKRKHKNVAAVILNSVSNNKVMPFITSLSHPKDQRPYAVELVVNGDKIKVSVLFNKMN